MPKKEGENAGGAGAAASYPSSSSGGTPGNVCGMEGKKSTKCEIRGGYQEIEHDYVREIFSGAKRVRAKIKGQPARRRRKRSSHKRTAPAMMLQRSRKLLID